jgi:hypothetical protein
MELNENGKKDKIEMNKLILTVVAAVIGYILGKYLIDGINGQRNIFDKQLVEAANQINKNLPIMVDSETRLDSTMALPNKKFTYIYTLINYTQEEIDSDELKELLEPNILNNIKTNSDLEEFRENKVTMVYLYKDKTGNEILKLEYSYNDYKI